MRLGMSAVGAMNKSPETMHLAESINSFELPSFACSSLQDGELDSTNHLGVRL
jgi:hypothetical protein